jgi:S-DNA-T family DNA segregation ATPase FtsK/SpoIIIE
MLAARARELMAFACAGAGLVAMVALFSYDPGDPSWNTSTSGSSHNLLGPPGAFFADALLQTMGWGAFVVAFLPFAWAGRLACQRNINHPLLRFVLGLWGALFASGAFTGFITTPIDALSLTPGGGAGILLLDSITAALFVQGGHETVAAGMAALSALMLHMAVGFPVRGWLRGVGMVGRTVGWGLRSVATGARLLLLRRRKRLAALRSVSVADRPLREPRFEDSRPSGAGRALAPESRAPESRAPESRAPRFTATRDTDGDGDGDDDLDNGRLDDRRLDDSRPAPGPEPRRSPLSIVTPGLGASGSGRKDTGAPAPARRPASPRDDTDGPDVCELPPVDLLQDATAGPRPPVPDEPALRRNAQALENVLSDFGVRGDVQKVHPGPVVTLYELEPAPGTKSSRVIGLAEDIARSMSAVSVRVAVVPGRNVIGIELPNARRETVLLREIIVAEPFERHGGKLVLALGKDIGGQPVVADLARFPHLLVAGTTGSGKSVAINTMILSLLYRLTPDRCRFIMIDPKMLELSVYEGIPHLLAPVVTDPKKAVVALKWTVREMEDRYRNMSKLGVRNIEGYNARLREARAGGESLTRRVQTGFDPDTGKPVFEEQPLDLTELPYIVVIVDEMADLMLVAGKDIEAAIQRLAQMARAAGIHLIMATQRPSVDVITGTIKANFPTRISFQVTSKIDSRTILGEQGAEQLLGQGDMLYMAGGGRITRVHGPFVSDHEVEQVVRFLKAQGEPSYVDSITEEDDDDGPSDSAGGGTGGAGGGSGDDLYDKAVAIVARERRASTSFIQRQLRIGYNSAARLIERMEAEGVISKQNHAGKREIFARSGEEN